MYVFYMSGRLSGGTMSRGSMRLSGSAKERPSRAWGNGGGGRGERLVSRCAMELGNRPSFLVREGPESLHAPAEPKAMSARMPLQGEQQQ